MKLFLAVVGFLAILLIFPSTTFALSNDYGVVGAIPSLSSDSAKQEATNRIADLGMGWTRHEFRYEENIDFAPYDAAHAKSQAKGIKTLGLLIYAGVGHDQWKNYVRSVVQRYGTEIPAWEVMNEADNYISGGDYVSYLKEAHEIIKGANPNATIVLSGITSRPETPNFWSAVAAAGGWNYFDVAGLHVYHDGNPEKVNFGGGDLLAEYDRAAAALKKNGGGKKIWITEMGYKAGEVGEQNQADWLARTLVMTRSVSLIEKVFIYRLWDGDGSTYGLTTSSFAERPAYRSVKQVIAELAGRGTGTRLYPQSKQVLDSFDSVTGWSTKATSNGTVTLSSAEGHQGAGMKIVYAFTADKAYAVAEKIIAISGQPQALGAWFYGDDTKNVWKYRFKDARGETFQADLGNLVSGWNYKQFTIGQDTAYVSWDGDGRIDYPISFNSFVVDRQGGEAASSGVVDELTAITGGADLYAFQFGDKVAYWKSSGSATSDLCGASRSFVTSVSYASPVNCTETPKVSTQTTTQAAASPRPTPQPSPSAAVPVSKERSTLRVDGNDIVADGHASYRIVLLIKDTAGKLVKDRQPVLKVREGSSGVTITPAVLVGDEWWSYVTATEPGQKSIQIQVGTVELHEAALTFAALPSPSPVTTPTALSTPSPSAEVTVMGRRNPPRWAMIVLGLSLAVAGFGSAILYRKLRK